MGKTQKRKASASPSTETGDDALKKKQKIREPKSQEEMRKSFKEVKDICKNIRDLLKKLPKKTDVPGVFAKWQKTTQSKWSKSTHLYSWNKNDILAGQCVQTEDNCWAISFYRQWYALMKIKGVAGANLTIEKIMDGVPLFYQAKNRTLKSIQHLVDFMKNEGYVEEILVHNKPEEESQSEDFEGLVERLLLDAPLVVEIDQFPSYFTSQGKDLLHPTSTELKRQAYEEYPSHLALLTGHGYLLEEGKEPLEFWELYDSYGIDWGYSGLTWILKGHGLIKSAYEMRVNRQE
ncbi:PREDICTED: uncharacterized protein LOC104722198 [Camelina sativa]|uniref:Uncharacterized protein LOC104722198 n=1 Tax=Camelina sativa TaxID=90675 RepID=A0ABM0UBA5_CAMSA|nr:PREDICTED: uncharacterized protein LOC104722198 [Camelina sativa]